MGLFPPHFSFDISRCGLHEVPQNVGALENFQVYIIEYTSRLHLRLKSESPLISAIRSEHGVRDEVK